MERLQRFLGIRPEVVAHDLHPDYASTRYALAPPGAGEGRRCSTTTRTWRAPWPSTASTGPVLGLAWDGTGYGTDGTAWGGELLLVRDGAFERLATLRPLRLAGSDEAIRQVWRIALAALDDAFDGAPPLDALRLFESVPARDRGGRPADGGEGPALAARPRCGPLLRRARRARSRAGAVDLRGPGGPRVEPRRGRGRDGGLSVRPGGGGRPRPGRPAAARPRGGRGPRGGGGARPRLGAVPRGHGRRGGGAGAAGRAASTAGCRSC